MQKSKLTLYIFIALVLGIVAGYLFNVLAINQVNARINSAETGVGTVHKALVSLKDTSGVDYKTLVAKQATLTNEIKNDEALRETKLQGFTILSDIFLRLIKVIVAPLVFTSLVVGVAKVENIKTVGRIGGKTLLWFLGATLVSLLLGMLLVNLFGPGKKVDLALPLNTATAGIQNAVFSLKDVVNHIFPQSFIEAMANNEILQIVVFSLFFGIGTAAIGEKGHIVIKVFEAITQVLLKITGYVMKFAPFAVFGAMAAIIAKQGLGILSTYTAFIGEFYLSLVILWMLIALATLTSAT